MRYRRRPYAPTDADALYALYVSAYGSVLEPAALVDKAGFTAIVGDGDVVMLLEPPPLPQGSREPLLLDELATPGASGMLVPPPAPTTSVDLDTAPLLSTREVSASAILSSAPAFARPGVTGATDDTRPSTPLPPLHDDTAPLDLAASRTDDTHIVNSSLMGREVLETTKPPAPSSSATSSPSAEKPIAFIRVIRRRHEIHISHLAIDERWRRRMIGSAFVKELIDEGLRASVPVSVHVPPRATAALAFLKYLGFHAVPSKEPGLARLVWSL